MFAELCSYDAMVMFYFTHPRVMRVLWFFRDDASGFTVFGVFLYLSVMWRILVRGIVLLCEV